MLVTNTRSFRALPLSQGRVLELPEVAEGHAVGRAPSDSHALIGTV